LLHDPEKFALIPASVFVLLGKVAEIFVRHNFLVVTVKKTIKIDPFYRSYRQNKPGSVFWNTLYLERKKMPCS